MLLEGHKGNREIEKGGYQVSAFIVQCLLMASPTEYALRTCRRRATSAFS